MVPVARQDASTLPAAFARAPTESTPAYTPAVLTSALRGADTAASGAHDHRGHAHPVCRGHVHLVAPLVRLNKGTSREASAEATRAAAILGISRRILKYKMDKLGISKSEPMEN